MMGCLEHQELLPNTQGLGPVPPTRFAQARPLASQHLPVQTRGWSPLGGGGRGAFTRA